jgi:polyribonucleotide nucleotidyltransferase
MKIARESIEGMTAEAEIGKIYRGRVVTVKEFGAFVEFLPGKDGLVHISELANFRVKQTEDIVKIGDEIWVKCLGVDEKGRVKLSRKAAMAERDQEMGGEPVPAGGGEDQGQGGEERAREERPREDNRGEGRDGGRGGDRGGERRGGDRGGDRGPRRH